MANYSKQMQKLFVDYQREVASDPADLHEVATWAIRKGLWKSRPSDILSQFSRDMASALREEYRTDSSGRRYRAKYAVRTTKQGKQTSLWADIDKAPHAHIEKAFAQRRKHVVGECHQLRLDVDHYNDTRNEKPIQLILDFTDDVEEILIMEGVDNKFSKAI